MRCRTVLAIALAMVSSVAWAQPFFDKRGEGQERQDLAAPQRPDLGKGFIEFLFGDSAPQASRTSRNQWFGPPLTRDDQNNYAAPMYANSSALDPMEEQRRSDTRLDPRYLRREVAYEGKESPGTIVIDTPNHFLYLVEPGGKAIRYGIGVGRPGFTWSGVHAISAMKEWPDWVPPTQMLKRQPYLPHFVPGGPNNPLGARALYLGSTLYRIHGSNEPWTIGRNVSSGCIRMQNADVIDLYERVRVGTKVIVL
ncbi:MAG TPA: L,D-transpeptidase [Pseudolabrys sp.]|nr:L,D-transpeptidase [Pseudolabrys sp.]